MKPKYIICPGYVISKTDGQHHYIGAMRLIRLYGVDPRDCFIYEPAPWWPNYYYVDSGKYLAGVRRLGPRYDGNYDLHEE